MQLMHRQGDGRPLREHLQAAMAAGAAPDERLARKPPRDGLALWEAFCELASVRPGGMGPGAVPLTEIEAWQRLHGVRLTSWELGTLLAMDRAALAQMNKPTNGV